MDSPLQTAFSRATQDMLRQEFILLSLLPFIVVMLLGIGMAGLFGSELSYVLETEVHELGTVESGVEPGWIAQIFQFLAGSYLVGFLSFLAYVLFGGIIIVFFNTLATAVAGMLSPWIVHKVSRIHYEDMPKQQGMSLPESLLLMLRSALIALLLFLFFIPLFFIPLFGFLAFYFPFWYFFHKTIVLDTWGWLSEWKTLYRSRRGTARVVTLGMFSAAALLPLIGVFLQIFYFILMTHYAALSYNENSQENDNNKEAL